MSPERSVTYVSERTTTYEYCRSTFWEWPRQSGNESRINIESYAGMTVQTYPQNHLHQLSKD